MESFQSLTYGHFVSAELSPERTPKNLIPANFPVHKPMGNKDLSTVTLYQDSRSLYIKNHGHFVPQAYTNL